MKEQFIKFLEDNHCLNPWMDGVRLYGLNSVKDPTAFVSMTDSSMWLSGAFDWAAVARKYYVDWSTIHYAWLEYIKTHTV